MMPRNFWTDHAVCVVRWNQLFNSGVDGVEMKKSLLISTVTQPWPESLSIFAHYILMDKQIKYLAILSTVVDSVKENFATGWMVVLVLCAYHTIVCLKSSPFKFFFFFFFSVVVVQPTTVEQCEKISCFRASGKVFIMLITAPKNRPSK